MQDIGANCQQLKWQYPLLPAVMGWRPEEAVTNIVAGRDWMR